MATNSEIYKHKHLSFDLMPIIRKIDGNELMKCYIDGHGPRQHT